VTGDTAVVVAGRRHAITPTMKRELRRRSSAIEAMIGHRKLDGKLGRNHLKGAIGDAIHALLAAAGHNLRLILRHLARLLRALPPGSRRQRPKRQDRLPLGLESTYSGPTCTAPRSASTG
jgi:hypothetical protein